VSKRKQSKSDAKRAAQKQDRELSERLKRAASDWNQVLTSMGYSAATNAQLEGDDG
jgi:hypothetical protein